jgi:hypothetical protein
MSLRLRGQFLLVGAIGTIISLLLIFAIPGPLGITGPESAVTSVVSALSGLLLLTGLPALYRAQASQVGVPGRVGVVLLWIAALLVLVVLSILEILITSVPGSIPHTAGHGPPLFALIPAIGGELLILIGGVIVGITTIWAHVFAPAIGWVMIIASVLVLLTAPISTAGVPETILADCARSLFFVSLAWAGATISFPAKPAERPTSSPHVT